MSYERKTDWKSNWGNTQRKEYYKKDYRVKTPIRSFRDLEVYKKTIQLSDEITNLDFFNLNDILKEDFKEIKQIAETIPRLLAESHGDRFDSAELAFKKITKAITLVTDIITKIDLLRERFKENKEVKETLDSLLIKYQTQKRKILNLRRAWDRIRDLKKNEFGNK